MQKRRNKRETMHNNVVMRFLHLLRRPRLKIGMRLQRSADSTGQAVASLILVQKVANCGAHNVPLQMTQVLQRVRRQFKAPSRCGRKGQDTGFRGHER